MKRAYLLFAAAALAATPEAADDAAHAIMTTDTVPKQASVSFEVGGCRVIGFFDLVHALAILGEHFLRRFGLASGQHHQCGRCDQKDSLHML